MTQPHRYTLDPKTLEMLVCPITKTRLIYDAEALELISVVARYAFPIKKGVPLLVLDAARKISEDEVNALRKGVKFRPAPDLSR